MIDIETRPRPVFVTDPQQVSRHRSFNGAMYLLLKRSTGALEIPNHLTLEPFSRGARYIRPTRRIAAILERIGFLIVLLRCARYVRHRQGVLFLLSFDAPSLFLSQLFLPRPTWAVVHNNYDWAARHRSGRAMLRRISRVSFLALQLGDPPRVLPRWLPRTRHIPFPIPGEARGASSDATGHTRSNYIFIASGWTQDVRLERQLVSAASAEPHCTFFVKAHESLGDTIGTHNNIIVRSSYDDYQAMMRNARAVVIVSRFDLRVSGVTVDAMALRTPVILMSSPFAHRVNRRYPCATAVVDSLEDIRTVKFDLEAAAGDWQRFYHTHSDSSIRGELINILSESERLVH